MKITRILNENISNVFVSKSDTSALHMYKSDLEERHVEGECEENFHKKENERK